MLGRLFAETIENMFLICGIIMLVRGAIGLALMHPEREARQWAGNMREPVIRSA